MVMVGNHLIKAPLCGALLFGQLQNCALWRRNVGCDVRIYNTPSGLFDAIATAQRLTTWLVIPNLRVIQVLLFGVVAGQLEWHQIRAKKQ